MTDTPALTLYNTLTRQKEPFRPIDAQDVRMYVCGPTVYDFAHIGNARPAIVFDVLFRLLRHVYGTEHVTYVRNITDVDDKINARALRDFPGLPLNEAIRAVTEKTLAQYLEDVAALGCLEPTHQPRATEHIDGMIAMIRTLISRGHAYVATGSEGREVLFDVTSMPEYGRLSRRNLEDQQAGARVAVEAHKKNPADFVLWKESEADEPGWNAEFDAEDGPVAIRGRPGWHIECSVMSGHFLGETFDIHGGGLDLIFPHHENEIAQSVCAHGETMANYWMHNGFLQVEGRKMSKSEGNFFTIHELLREWSGPAMRLIMLQTHYRQPINWTADKLLAARSDLAQWVGRVFDGDLLGAFEGDLLSGKRPPIDDRVIGPLYDDLNTVESISGLHALYSEAGNRAGAYALLNAAHFLGLFPLRKLGALLTNSTFGSAPIQKFTEYLNLYNAVQVGSANSIPEIIADANAVVGDDGLVFHVGDGDGFVSLDMKSGASDAQDEIKALIDRRLALIGEKNWAEADRIRDELASQGIQLKDSKDPETGERVTTWEVKR